MDRVVVTLKAQNKLEAKAALELLLAKVNDMKPWPWEPIEESVVVTNEGTVK